MILSTIELLLGALVIVILAGIAIEAGTVNFLGAFSGSLIAFVSLVAGGLFWLIYIVIFFAISSSMTKYRYDYKQMLESAEGKGGRRSWPNTVANGSVPAAAAIGQIMFPSVLFEIAFLSSVAAAMSDTLATEVGLLSQSKPRLITNLKTIVVPGLSGGITSLGILVSIATAIGMGLGGTVLLFPSLDLAPSIFAISFGAFGGTLIDSILGATIQNINKCEACGKLVELEVHHGTKASHLRGLKFIDNNLVNFLGTLTSALIAFSIYLIMV